MTLCANCYEELSMNDIFFCPQCGAVVVIKNKDIQLKTTQNYDPTNRDYKPWREVTILPSRIKSKSKSVKENKKLTPWYPAMRQPIQSVVRSKLYYHLQLQSTDVNIDDDAGELQTEIETKGVNNELTVSIDQIDGNNSPSSSSSPILDSIGKEIVEPLASYETNLHNGIIVHLSLIQQTFGHNKIYWIRIGTAANTFKTTISEDSIDHNLIKENDPTTSDNLKVIKYISNDVGKFLLPNIDDWVHLNLIDPNEYYMIHHLQNMLKLIAYRVMIPLLYDVLSSKSMKCYQHIIFGKYRPVAEQDIQQNELRQSIEDEKDVQLIDKPAEYLTRRQERVNNIKINDIPDQVCIKEHNYEKFLRNKSSVRGNDSYKMQSYDEVIPIMTSSSPSSALKSKEYPSLIYNDSIAETVVKLKIDRNVTISWCLCRVRLRVHYRNLLTKEALTFGITSPSSSPTCNTNTKLTPETFRESSQFTHLSLHLFPYFMDDYSDTITIPYVTFWTHTALTFERNTLLFLLKKPVSDIDNLLMEGNRQELQWLIKQLMKHVRLEYTRRGPRFQVSGCMMESSNETLKSKTWPYHHDVIKLEAASDEL